MAEFTGKVVSKTATTYVGQNQSPTFEFMLEELNPNNPEYPQNCVLSVFGKKVEEISPLIKKDAVVKATFDYQGRKWQDKLFGKNSVWKVESAEVSNQPPTQAPTPAPAVPAQAPTNNQPIQEQGNSDGGDLPF